MSRAANSAKNIVTINISRILIILFNFITRTVLIKTLGNEYLGITNLFTNILQMLSLADLGVGTAIIFKLYQPIEEHNNDRIIALMKLYKRIYEVIGCVIVLFGVILAPFLPHLINDFERFEQLNLNAYFIFALYVFNTASTYWFFAYKQAIVRAHQKSYMLTMSSYLVNIASYGCQILCLIFFRNFIGYTVIIILFNIIQNFVFARIADKHYPFVKQTTSEKVTKEEIKEIIKDCGSLFLYKSNSAIVTASDNIIISKFLGLSAVGIFSNYSVISLSIRDFLVNIVASMEASIGSINATGKMDWKRNIFKTVNFATIIIYSIVSIGVFVMMDDFINLWLGSDYLINSYEYGGKIHHFSLPLLFGVEIFILGSGAYLSAFRQSFGLFRQLKWRPLFTIIINLAVGIVATKYIGVAGTVVGTIVAFGTTVIIVDPIVIIKNSLDMSVRSYFLKNAWYTLVTVGTGSVAWYVCSLIPGEGVLRFIIKGTVCVAVTVIIFFVVYFRSSEFKMLLTFLPENVRNKIKFIR